MRHLRVVESPGRKPTLYDDLSGIYLHSRYDPEKEARQFAASQYDEETCNFILYGFGLGYVVKALSSNLRENQRLWVFELRSELPELADSLNVCSSQMLVNTEVITPVSAGGHQAFLERFRVEIAKPQVRLVLHMPSVKIIDPHFDAFKHALEDWNLIRYIPLDYQDQLKINREYNQKAVIRNVNMLFGSFPGADALIIAAGPSLKETMPALKAHLLKKPEGTLVIAVGRVLKVLLDEGIRPDFVTVIDPTCEVYQDIEGIEATDIPMVLLDTTYYRIAERYQGDKFLAINKKQHLRSEDPESSVISTGGSVATLALACAVLFGCSRIFFFGQDLGSYGDQRHFDSEAKQKRLANMRTVRDYKGEEITTTLGLLSFKRWIERVIADNRQILFYNVSLGAHIAGTVHLTQEQFLEKAGGH